MCAEGERLVDGEPRGGAGEVAEVVLRRVREPQDVVDPQVVHGGRYDLGGVMCVRAVARDVDLERGLGADSGGRAVEVHQVRRDGRASQVYGLVVARYRRSGGRVVDVGVDHHERRGRGAAEVLSGVGVGGRRADVTVDLCMCIGADVQ